MFSSVLIGFTISFLLQFGCFSGERFSIQSEQNTGRSSLNKRLHQWLITLVVLDVSFPFFVFGEDA